MTFQAISSGMPSLWDWLFHCVYYGYRCCSLVGTQLLLVLNLFMLLYKKETANSDRWTTCLLSIHRGPQTQNCPFLLRLMLLFLTTLIVCPSLHNFPIDTQSYTDSPTFSLNTTFVLILYLCPLLYVHFHFFPLTFSLFSLWTCMEAYATASSFFCPSLSSLWLLMARIFFLWSTLDLIFIDSFISTFTGLIWVVPGLGLFFLI